MIQIVITTTSRLNDGFGGEPVKWLAFHEDGVEVGKLQFASESVEVLTGAFRAVNIPIFDLTKQPDQDETQQDV